MDNSIATFENDIMIAREEALQLDQQIKVYANMAWQNLVESCKCLKRMKDTEGYKALGYATFGDYTKASLNIEERQAYTYISTIEKQGEAFLQSNASLGITKLSLLNAIPDIEREEFVENHDLAGMSVKEVKQLVEENNHKAEQIELLTDERDELKEERDDLAFDLESAERTISRLEDELEREKNKPTEVAVAEPDKETLEKIRAEAAQSARKEAEKAAKAEIKALKEKHKSEQEKAVAQADEKAKKELEEYKQKCEAADGALSEAMARAAELEKQLAVASSPETTRFTFFFEALDNDLQRLIASLSEIKKTSPEVADKYGAAMQEYYKIIAERFGNIGYPMNEEKSGHWKEDATDKDFGFCSICGASGCVSDNFCSGCGARMGSGL